MQNPQNYIIVDNKDGTFSAFVNYGVFESKEDIQRPLLAAAREDAARVAEQSLMLIPQVRDVLLHDDFARARVEGRRAEEKRERGARRG